MPSVLKINNTKNQGLLFLRAAFHRPNSFQSIDQKITKTNIGMHQVGILFSIIL